MPVRRISLLLLVLVGASVVPAAAQEITDTRSFQVGVWLQDVYDLSVADGSFSASFWIWSRGINATREPLKTMQFVNMSESTEAESLYQQQQKGPIYWSQRLVQGKFRYDWDVSNFPFDRHSLRIVVDEGLEDTSAFRYLVDSRGSSYSDKIALDGWRITGFKLEGRPVVYNTTFGNPTLSYDNRSFYPELVMTLDIQRDELMSFIKLLSILYLSFALSLVTYFLPHDALDGRIGLAVGALFAGAFNMREVSATLGSDQGLTLADQIHIIALVLIGVATVVAMMSNRMVASGWSPKQIDRFNYITCAIAAVSFVVINVVLIAIAVQQG